MSASMTAADVDAMDVDALRATAHELIAVNAQNAATIADLRAQLGGEVVASPRASPAASPMPKQMTQADMEAEMELQKQQMIEAMLADGTISQEEFEEMVERNAREKEKEQTLQRKRQAWDEAKGVWNEKGCKKGMLAIEKNWKDIGEGEPFTMHAVANLFRTQSGGKRTRNLLYTARDTPGA
jgi:hypothetical protein